MTFLSTEPKFSDSDNVLLGKILQQLITSPGGGGSGSQTPWASAINGGGFNLSNVATITATSVVSTLTGNASTATVLQTARTINGVSFNGSADITLPAGNQTPWASNIDGAGFDLNDVTSVVAVEVAAENFAVLAAGTSNLGVLLSFSGATFTIADTLLDPKLTYDGALWDFVGVVEADGLSSNGQITATNKLQITQANINTAVFTSTGYSLTGSNATSLIDLAGTWNTSGNPVALKLAISNTASGATSKFISCLAGAAGASEFFSVDKVGTIIFGDVAGGNAARILFTAGLVTFGRFNGVGAFEYATNNNALAVFGQLAIGSTLAAKDTILERDAANTLALRNGVNAQRARIYNTFTTLDTSGEWLKIDWQVTANQCRIGTVMGTSAGTARVLSIDYGALSASPTAAITIPITSGAIVFGGGGTFNGSVTAAQASFFTWSSRSLIGSTADGVIWVANVAGTDFSRLGLGGTTDSFGAVGRDGAGVKIVGGAGGSTAWIKVPGVIVASLPAAATAGAGAVSFVTDAVSQVFGATVTGGGSVPSPVYSDGTVWRTG